MTLVSEVGETIAHWITLMAVGQYIFYARVALKTLFLNESKAN